MNLYLATFSHTTADPTAMVGIVSYGTLSADNISRAYMQALKYSLIGLKLAIYTLSQDGKTSIEAMGRFALLEQSKAKNLGHLDEVLA